VEKVENIILFNLCENVLRHQMDISTNLFEDFAFHLMQKLPVGLRG
jgi:hypothetical protein